MKYLSDYMKDSQTKLLRETGAFFAFSEKQFAESKKEGVEYVGLDAGLICPNKSVDALIDGLERIYREGVRQDIEENGIHAIIQRELGNHECQLTGSIQECVDALAGYPITREQIQSEWKEFLQMEEENENL